MRAEDWSRTARVANALAGAYFNGGHTLVRMTAAEVGAS